MFLRRLLIYGAGQFLAKGVAIALLPIYTRILTADGFGRASLGLSAAAVVASLVFVEVWTGLLRMTISRNRDRERSLPVFRSALLLVLVALPVFVVAITLLNALLDTGLMLASCLYGAFYALNSLWQSFARGCGFSGTFVQAGILAAVVQLIFAIVALLAPLLDPSVMLFGPALGFALSTCYIEMRHRFLKDISFQRTERAALRPMVAFSFPLALSATAYWALSQFGAYYVALMEGYAQSGLINAAIRYSAALLLLVSVFNFAWQESAFESSHSAGRGDYFELMLSRYMGLTFCIGGGFVAVSPLLFPLLVGGELSAAMGLVPLYIIAVLLGGIGTFCAQLLGAENGTKDVLTSTAVGALVNVVLLVAASPYFGLIVAPIALVVGQAVTVGIRLWRLQAYVRVRVNLSVSVRGMTWLAVCVWVCIAPLSSAQHALVLVALLALALVVFSKELAVVRSAVLSLRGRRKGYDGN